MTTPALQVANVSKIVGHREILHDVSFDVPRGSLVTLIGPNGAGKSTLIKIILGLETTFTGSVTIAPDERIQYIPQLSSNDVHQLPLSVHEYLSIGSAPLFTGKPVITDFSQALEHVGVNARVLTQTYASLSGGERQRIAIARALLSKPTILVLDEPVAAVDYASRQGLYELIRHLQRDHQMTVLLVSHDVESVMPLSDRVLCLNITLHQDCHPVEIDTKDPFAKTVHHHC